MLDHEGPVPLYQQVADIIRRDIASGVLAPGQAVPSEAQLQAAYGIARTTARRAVRELRDQGLVYVVQGEGAFVGPPDTPRATRDTPAYKRIAAAVAGRIRSGELQPDRPIPSETTLMQQYEVAKGTVRQAVAHLREQGWVYTVPQRGSFVSPRENWPSL